MRYFIGFLVTVGLIILVIILLVSGGPSKPKIAAKSLSSYSNTDAVVRLTMDGPITAPVNRASVRITVGRDQAVYQQYQGYNGTIVNSQTTDNTENSYYAFLRALGLAGFTNGSTIGTKNSTGYCPLGQVFTFELIENGKTLQQYWATSCGGPKTFNGNTQLNLTLFQAQIPNYSTLRSQVTAF